MAVENGDFPCEVANFDDLVLSTVHVSSKNHRKCLDQELAVTDFKFEVLAESSPKELQKHGICYDEDGDVSVERKCNHDIKEAAVTIYHCMATPLVDVGKQLWLGALLLGDWILHNPSLFQGSDCLELGAGTGLCSILAGMYCKQIFCTDTGPSVLDICQKNVDKNKSLLKYGTAGVKVRELNWMCDGVERLNDNTDSCGKFDWTHEDVCELKDVDIFLAADVIYDNTLTEGLFCKLMELMEKSVAQETQLFISIEKRINFTVDELDVACPAYNYFMKMLKALESGCFPNTSRSHLVQRLDLNFPRYFDYERPKELELWKVTSSKM